MCKCDCHIKKCDCQRSEKEGRPKLDCLWNWSVNICIIMIFLLFYFFFSCYLCYSHPRVWKRTVHFIHPLLVSILPVFHYFNNTTPAKRQDPSSPTKLKKKLNWPVTGCVTWLLKMVPSLLKAHVASCLFCFLSIYKTVGKKFFIPYILDWRKEISATFLRTSLLWQTEILLKLKKKKKRKDEFIKLIGL